MSASVQSWIRQAAATPGVLACGLRKADRSIAVRCSSPELTATQFEKTMAKLFEAIQTLQQNQIHTDRVRWSFETVHLHCAAPPGGMMAVVLVNKDGADDTQIDHLLAWAPLTAN